MAVLIPLSTIIHTLHAYTFPACTYTRKRSIADYNID